MSLFSIVVPVYNTEKYLLDCLNSISNQSFNDFEVIVINDGSTDGCQAIIDKYTKSDSRFKCINQENCGLSAARNTGFSNSKGTWVLFLDSDDLLLYNALETLKFIVNTSSYDIVHFNLESFIKEIPKIRTNEEIKTLEIKSRKAIFTLPPMTVVNLYSRDFLIRAKLCFPPIYHEDEVETFRLFCCAKSIIVLDRVLYLYRKHASSITGFKINKKSTDILKVFDYLLDYSHQYTEFANELQYKAYTTLVPLEGTWSNLNDDWAKKASEEAKTKLKNLDISDNPYFFVSEATKAIYENSISWKITKPIRTLKVFLKKLKIL